MIDNNTVKRHNRNSIVKEETMKTITVANQKGGVGKSTLCLHLAHAARERGQRVLLVDMDKQGSLSMSWPMPDQAPADALVASELFSGGAERQPVQIEDGLGLIAADAGLLALDGASIEVTRQPRRSLKRFAKDYDLCLIDTPPALGIRLFGALAAADAVIVPVSIGIYELAGVLELLATITRVQKGGYNPYLRLAGILPMKINQRSREQRDGLAELRSSYAGVVLDTVVQERAAVRTAVQRRIPVWRGTRGQSHARAGQEWRAACSEIFGRIEK